MRLLYYLFFLIIIFSVSCQDNAGDSTLLHNQPNIILIVTDDDDYSTLSSFGGEVPSPNLQSLMDNGSYLTNFYNNSRCSPTRASILSGMYPHRVGVGDLCELHTITDYECYKGYLDTTVTIIPEYLKTIGYNCYMSGKWHLGGIGEVGTSNKTPINRGFDSFFGIIKGASDYFGKKNTEYFEGNTFADLAQFKDFYSTDAFTTKGLQFIQESAKNRQPFFLYLPYTAPHAPIAAKEKIIQHYKTLYQSSNLSFLAEERHRKLKEKKIIDPKWSYTPYPKYNDNKPPENYIDNLSIHAAMMHTVDDNIGRILDFLKSNDILENTIVMFLSDNGGTNTSLSGSYNVPFEGKKTELFEGGIKTSCIFSWPNKDLNTRIRKRLHVVDILPTILDITNCPNSINHDGISFYSDLIKNNRSKSATRDYLIWDLYGQQAVINKNWKWINDKKNNDYLFNLRSDGFEQHNIIDNHPDIVRKLKKVHSNYSSKFKIPDFKKYKKVIKRKRKKILNRQKYQLKNSNYLD